MLRHLACASCVALLLSAPARADLAKLSATYDGLLENTVFTITNDSTVSEAVKLLTSLGGTQVTLPNLGAGTSETYSFNQISGGFINDPVSAGVPDTTTYTLLVGLSNATPTLSSGPFSPLSNLTGQDVDFLGNQCNGIPGGSCGTTIALSGVVASVAEPVATPEPASTGMLLAGLTGLGLISRRRA